MIIRPAQLKKEFLSIIVAYVKQETAKIDALRAAEERTSGLRKERHATSVEVEVTGKIQLPLTSAEVASVSIIGHDKTNSSDC